MMNAAKETATVKHHFIARDFSLKTRNALTRKGITVIGCCVIPGEGDMAYANGTRGYELSDNGCMRIRSHAEVREMAGVG